MKYQTTNTLGMFRAVLFAILIIGMWSDLDAQTWKSGATTVTLSHDGTLRVSGKGAMRGNSRRDIPWVDYRSSITSLVIEEGVTSIRDYAFNELGGLKSVTIPNSVTSIGDYAFLRCTSLTSITIPSSVTSIGKGVFWGCSSLLSVTIPSSVTSIGSWAFADCISLTSFAIPNSVIYIDKLAFLNCINMIAINVNRGNPLYSSVDGVVFNKTKDTLILYPQGKQGAYVIPNSVTSIGPLAFAEHMGLTSVTIPNSVKSIEVAAFSACTSLTSVTIPNSVTSIQREAFFHCIHLTSVTSLNPVPPTRVDGDNAFYGVHRNAIIYVPETSINAYRLAPGWNEFDNIRPLK
jgi:hypothetical protein